MFYSLNYSSHSSLELPHILMLTRLVTPLIKKSLLVTNSFWDTPLSNEGGNKLLLPNPTLRPNIKLLVTPPRSLCDCDGYFKQCYQKHNKRSPRCPGEATTPYNPLGEAS